MNNSILISNKKIFTLNGQILGEPIPPIKGKALNDYTWDEINYISQNNLATEYGFQPGDTKLIHIEGNIDGSTVNNDYNVFILGINHNGEQGITFGTFKTIDGMDICLCHPDNGQSALGVPFTMYWGSGYSGWQRSYMRNYTLGSTDSFLSDGATLNTAINPKKSTFMAALPSDLRKVLKPMIVYSDNVGNGENNNSNVTATTDYLPLLSEYEVFGVRTYANSAESIYQAQYDYYKNGNSTIKYGNLEFYGETIAMNWYLRSTRSTSTTAYCFVNTDGELEYIYGSVIQGASPIFRV